MPGGGGDSWQSALSTQMKSWGKQWKPSKIELHAKRQAQIYACSNLEKKIIINELRSTLQQVLYKQIGHLPMQVVDGLIRMIRGIERYLNELWMPAGGYFSIAGFPLTSLASCSPGQSPSRGPPRSSHTLPFATTATKTPSRPGLFSSLQVLFHNLSVSAKVGIAAGTLAAIIAASPVQRAEALPITPTTIGNFLVSGEYNDSGAQFQINYTGPTNDSGFYGNQVKLENVNFGGNAVIPMDWTKNLTSNLNGSTNYQFNSTALLENIRGPPWNASIGYAPQNGVSVPDGIGSMALTGSIPIRIYDSGSYIDGYLAAPLPIANGPTPVPEPASAFLLALGLASLAVARRYEK